MPTSPPAACDHAVKISLTAYLGDKRRPRRRGVRGVQAVHIGEQDERVGGHEVCDDGGEPIVIAEADLGCCHRIVFVDDGDTAQLVQAGDGGLDVAGAVALPGIGCGEEHLAHGDAVAGEALPPRVGELDLPHGRGGLPGSEVSGSGGEPQRRPAHGNSTGGDEDNVADLGPGGDGIDDPVDRLGVHVVLGGGNRARPHLDHELAGSGDLLSQIHYPSQRSVSASWP